MPGRVPLIFGAAVFGDPKTHVAQVHTIPEAQEFVDVFVSHGYTVFDAARSYGLGSTERFLGQLDLKGGRVDTKLSPRPAGNHSPPKLREAMNESLKCLGPHKIRVLYLHGPDRSVSYEETHEEIDKMYKQGLFEEFGLSNFMSWEVAEFVGRAREKGWIKPTVYQGGYNALERSIETELIPCLKKYGIRFYAYSPLAGGLLTGRFLTEEDLNSTTGNRWGPTSPLAPYLRKVYTPLLPVFRELKTVLDGHNIGHAEAALRWLQHHSVLTPSDGVVIGVSKLQHVNDNITWSEAGPLPEAVLNAIDEVWRKAKGDMPHYS